MADVHIIRSDPNLPDGMTPLQYKTGVTPDISAFLQFSFWQPVLYLDHESEWSSLKERSGRWVGIAHNNNDPFTFWIFDDQTIQLLARSVVRPFSQNHQVKWDSSLINWGKHTATHARDVKPEKSIQSNPGKVKTEDNTSPDPKPPDPKPKEPLTVLKPTFINPSMDTKTLVIPRTSIVTRLKGKLLLDNSEKPMDNTTSKNPFQ